MSNLKPGLKPNVKGEPRRGGRQRGQLNKFNQHVKDLILLAADEVGDVTMYLQNGTEDPDTGEKIINTPEDRGGALGYLKWLAVHEPKSYAGMLARMIPMQVTQTPGSEADQFETREELEAELKRRGLPTTPIFSTRPPQPAIEYKDDSK